MSDHEHNHPGHGDDNETDRIGMPGGDRAVPNPGRGHDDPQPDHGNDDERGHKPDADTDRIGMPGGD
jgi:hypothetical protein